MAEIGKSGDQASMTLGKGVGIYIACLFGFLTLMGLAGSNTIPGGLAIGSYFIFGFIMNRIVLRGLIEFHPVYNTLQNVSSSKLSAFLFWPLSYIFLFFKLAVVKVL